LVITTVVHSAGQSLHTFCHRWRDTDEMSLKSSETADGRVIGRGECSYLFADKSREEAGQIM